MFLATGMEKMPSDVDTLGLARPARSGKSWDRESDGGAVGMLPAADRLV